MISSQAFIQRVQNAGFHLFTGVPCSYLKPFINYVIDSEEMTYIGAANEGDAVGIAAGADLAGKRSIVMFQNSGLGNAVNPLSSLNAIFKIPCLLIVTHRGNPEGAPDEPQHELMGKITHSLLNTLEIPTEPFPTDEAQIDAVLERALSHMNSHQTPYCLVMNKGDVEAYALQTREPAKPLPSVASVKTQTICPPGEGMSREEALSTIQSAAQPSDLIAATTGFTGRALYALGDHDNQIYMVGSMGCISSMALGMAWAQPHRRVIAIDGDGSALMRLGAFATVGYERPSNLVHILLDNGLHESTGGQTTISRSVDFAQVAAACGYPRVESAQSPEELASLLADLRDDQLTFIRVFTRPTSGKDLPRPTITPAQVAERLKRFIEKGNAS